MTWHVVPRNGIHLPQIGWWLDAHHPAPRSFVSHAHFDHLAAHREIICSAGTARLMRARLPAERVEHVLPFGQTEQITPDCTATLHPAGHIHGSAQILLEHVAHGRLLYTGDFKLRPGRSAEPCATPRANTVIMETTYGRPHYAFPPTEEVLAAVAAFCRAALADGETPVLFGYSLGKSQELLSGLAAAGLPLMLHPRTLELTRVYEELGMAFPAYAAFDATRLAGHVVICPPQSAGSAFLKKIKKRRTAAITGWALDPGARFRYQCDEVFPLSDHADYPDLLRFVELVQPARVLTVHGFAEDFARDLRARGIEAWALGRDNQLEIPLATPPRVVVTTAAQAAASADCHLISDNLPEASEFERFAETAEQVKVTPAKLEKVELVAQLLRALPAESAALAALYLTGRAFPQASDRTLNLGWAALKRTILELTGRHAGDYRQAYQRTGDGGETAELLFAGHTRSAPATLPDIAADLARIAGTAAPLVKIDTLKTRLAALSPRAGKYLLKIITGDLRIGLKEGLVEEAIAAAHDVPAAAVREANLLCGDIAAVARAAREGTLADIGLRVFNPLQCMLASPEPDAAAIIARLGAPVWLEEKYDGIRCQLHKLGDRVALYSRDLHDITAQFPDLAAAARALPADVVLDGELLAWRDGRALPFAELQRRLGRRGDDFFLGAEIPVSFSAFDLLWINGRPLLKSPLRTRRQEMDTLAWPAGLRAAPVTEAADETAVDAAFLRSRERGNEGLIAKDPASPYTPGRRGLAWLKLKKAHATLDVVVVAVEYGHGKRKGVLSDYTFAVRAAEDDDRLLTIGKAYSGLTNAEIATLTGHFLARVVGESGRRLLVEPDTVLEVAFDSIRPSDRHDGGYALRFPRIVRIRDDKTPAQIDTLDTCRRLAGAEPAARKV